MIIDDPLNFDETFGIYVNDENQIVNNEMSNEAATKEVGRALLQ